MKACLFLVQSLGRIYFEKNETRQLSCSTLPLPIPEPFTHTYKFKPIDIFNIVSFFKLSASKEVRIAHLSGSFTYTFIIPKSFNSCCKTSLHPPEKEREILMAFIPVQ